MTAKTSLQQQIKTVLQDPPFRLKIKKIKKINTGGSSKNYIGICPNQKYFIKILDKAGKAHAERLIKISTILNQNLLPNNLMPYFELTNNIGLIQTYISRKELKAKDLTKSKIDLISKAYKLFQETAQKLQNLALAGTTLEASFQNNRSTIENLKSSGFFDNFFIKKIKKLQQEIYVTPPHTQASKTGTNYSWRPSTAQHALQSQNQNSHIH